MKLYIVLVEHRIPFLTNDHVTEPIFVTFSKNKAFRKIEHLISESCKHNEIDSGYKDAVCFYLTAIKFGAEIVPDSDFADDFYRLYSFGSEHWTYSAKHQLIKNEEEK